MTETELLLRDVTRAWRLWKAAESAMPARGYEEASPQARARLLEAHDALRAALDAALDAVERGQP